MIVVLVTVAYLLRAIENVGNYNYPSSSQTFWMREVLVTNLRITYFISGPSVSPYGESVSAIEDDRDTQRALPSGVGETEEEIAGLSG